MKNTFYGIGVGPGDPKLLTLKAIEKIKKAKTIFVPIGKDNKPGYAYKIAQDYILDKPVFTLKFPMINLSQNQDELINQWKNNVEEIIKALEKGDVVFLTIGDPFLYSTYCYLFNYLKENTEYQTKTIPGITSFNALASKINTPLALGEESLAICSLTQSEEEIRKIFQNHQNIIVMKASGKNLFLSELIKEFNLENNFIIVSNLGLENESIFNDLRKLEEGIPYLSTILIKKDYDFTS